MVEKLYTVFAPYYDVLYQIRDAEGQAEFVLEQFERFGQCVTGNVLVLGCGTGIHSQYFVAAGFDLVGIDKYEQMLEIARERTEGTFRRGILPDIELNDTFDIVFLPGTVINYLSQEELGATFDLINSHLSKKGILVFDFGTLFDIKGFEPPFFHAGSDRDNDVAQLVQLRRIDERTTQWNGLIFADLSNRQEFFVDIHEVTVHRRKELEQLLSKRGFDIDIHPDGYVTGDYFDYTIETIVAR